MSDVFVIGVGQIQFGRHKQQSVRTMAEQATHMALLDAGLEKADLQAVYFSNTFWGLFGGQHSLRGQTVARGMGIDRIPVFNVENACAGGSTAIHAAFAAIRGGLYDVVLVLGSEKLSDEEVPTVVNAYNTCSDIEKSDAHLTCVRAYKEKLRAGLKDNTHGKKNTSSLIQVISVQALWHMLTYGTTTEQIAHISSKNHFHGAMNPRAQYQRAMTVAEILGDDLVTYPFTRPMCAPISDGAAAAVVCSDNYLRKLAKPRPVRIAASVVGQGSDRDLAGEDVIERVAKQAYAMAGIGPDRIDFAEVNDPTSFAELRATEALGFCARGEGGRFAVSGATTLGGEIPVNTSGGLCAQGHPSGASGLAQVHEAVCQLRGEAGQRQVADARVGLAENAGGNFGLEEAVVCIHLFEKAI